MVDESGLYITVAQMGLFLNDKGGPEKFRAASHEFLKFYKKCCLYNLVFDMMEANPQCAKMYWDVEAAQVALSFPTDGLVAEALLVASHSFDLSYEEDGEDEGDEDYDSFL